jgi:hypothetical protein
MYSVQSIPLSLPAQICFFSAVEGGRGGKDGGGTGGGGGGGIWKQLILETGFPVPKENRLNCLRWNRKT